MDLAGEFSQRLRDKDYRAAKTLVNEGKTEPLAEAWPRLPLFERLLMFKLLRPPAARRLFERLDDEGRYLVFTGFDLGAVAPVLEGLDAGERALFEVLPPADYERMAAGIFP